MVLDKFGKDVAEKVEWFAPRLLCIAGGFTKYDEHAVKQMNRNIELIRYRHFDDDLLLFELVNAASATNGTNGTKPSSSNPIKYKTVSEYLSDADTETHDLFEGVKAFLEALGDDVQTKELRFYYAFKRIKNFACLEIRPQKRVVLVYVKVDPDTVKEDKGFLRDVRNVGHYGTGDLEITISCAEDLEKAKPFLEQSYEAS